MHLELKKNSRASLVTMIKHRTNGIV